MIADHLLPVTGLLPKLPEIATGPDVYQLLPAALSNLTSKVLLIGGKRALAAGLPALERALSGSGIQLEIHTYTGLPSRQQAGELAQLAVEVGAGAILGMGGGRALDAAKAAAKFAGLPVFCLPTIPATCAAVSGLSVMYDQQAELGPFLFLDSPPQLVLLNTKVLVQSPPKYLRAGMGDSIAKYAESSFKAGNREKLGYADLVGLSIGQSAYESLLVMGSQALVDAQQGVDSHTYRLACQCCVISPGLVSILVQEHLNGALAHSLYYAVKDLPGFISHLHGDIVAWGSLVQSVLEGKDSQALQLLGLLKLLGIPNNLAMLNTTMKEVLPLLPLALQQPDMQRCPYPVSVSMVQNALEKADWLSSRKGR